MNQIVITLPQLIDLGLCSPEVGAVNFNVLHSVLHIIVQQLNATNLNVEFQGDDATRIEALINKNEPCLNVTVSDPSIILEKGESQLSVLDETETKNETQNLEKPSESFENLSANKSQTVIVQTFGTHGAHVTDHTFVSKEILKKVEHRIDKIENEIIDIVNVPTNTQIIETLRSRSQHSIFDKSRPIFDLWQTLNLNKRVDAIETTIEKVSGFVEELVRTTPGRQQEIHVSPKSSVGAIVVDHSEKYCHDLKSFFNERGGAENFFENCDDIYNQIRDWRNLFGEVEIESLVSRIKELESNLQEVMSRQIGITEFQPYELIEKISSLDTSLKELNKELQRVDGKYDTLFDKIETINTVKTSFEDLEDALAQKADILALNEKVSTTEFNQCFSNALESIENIMQKLQELEQICQNDLNEIQIKLATKPNKSDLDSVQNYLLKRINELNNQLKSFSVLKDEQEASGAKNKYIRNLKCISCDNRVYMTKDLKDPVVPKLKSMVQKTNYNLPSFISYKLDALRKQETTPCALNLNKFEEALAREKKDLVSRKFADIGRTCGGKYTITAPVERVTKIGNFLSQWNQGYDSVEHTLVQGTDGKMYRAVKVVPIDDDTHDDCICYHDNPDQSSMND